MFVHAKILWIHKRFLRGNIFTVFFKHLYKLLIKCTHVVVGTIKDVCRYTNQYMLYYLIDLFREKWSQ